MKKQKTPRLNKFYKVGNTYQVYLQMIKNTINNEPFNSAICDDYGVTHDFFTYLNESGQLKPVNGKWLLIMEPVTIKVQ